MSQRLQPMSNRSVNNRTRVRGFGSSNCVVKSTQLYDFVVPGPGAPTDWYGSYLFNPVDPASTQGVVTTISGCYEFFRIRSAMVEYVPTGGTNESGRLTWAFIDNPEIMMNYKLYGDSGRNQVIMNTQGMESTSLAFPRTKTWNNTRVVSRNWYQVNSQLLGTDQTDYDRSVPTMLAVKLFRNPLTPSGSLVFHITYEFSGLGYASYATLAASVSDEGYRLTFPDDGNVEEYPDTVTVRCQRLGDQLYRKVLPTPPPPGTTSEPCCKCGAG